MTGTNRYRLVIAPAARRQLSDTLPEPVAVAAYQFIVGPLLTNPQRVGKLLHKPLDGRYSARSGTYRVVYRIDENVRTVTVLAIVARADAYSAR